MDAEQEFLHNHSDVEREHYLPFDAGIKPGMQVFAKRLGVIATSPLIVLSRWTGIDAALGFPSWHQED